MISVIVPTLDEKEIIEDFLKELKKALLGRDFEVIIVDDSKSLETVRTAKDASKKYKIALSTIHRAKKLGKGSAINDGLKKAKGSEQVIIDADLEYSPREIPKMLKKLENADAVCSVRIRKDAIHRRALATGFRALTALLFGMGFDTQSGLKVFKKKTLKGIELTSKGWVWDVELLYKIKKKGANIALHQIVFKKRKKGRSKIRPISSSINMLLGLLKLRLDVK